jgi:release factor glutamine methyltransferase
VSDAFAGQSIEAARRALAVRFRSHGIESPELDARLLIGAVLGLDLTGLIVAAARELSAAESASLQGFADRRIAGEPVARILGMQEFWGLPLTLSAETLVPRPDTETVVAAALELLRGHAIADDRPRIADLGTGSGALLLALLSELPQAFGIGTDIGAEALRTARGNAFSLGLQQRAAFVACDYAQALAGPFDLIVSNPPYIVSAEIDALAVEVRTHDPRRALDGGDDGLDAYRRIIPQAAGLLAPGGLLVVEIGRGQQDDVQALMQATGLQVAAPPKADLAGIARAVTGRKPPR